MTHDPSTPLLQVLVETPEALQARLEALEAQVVHLQTALNQAWPLFQESPGAAFLLNPQGQVLEVNTQGAALLRFSQTTLRGRSLTASLVASSRTTFASLLVRVFEGQESQRSELQVLTSDGDVLEVSVDAAFSEGRGGPPHCHLTLTDVTAFKLAHRVLWDTQQAQDLEVQEQVQKLRQLQKEFETVVLKTGQELDATLNRAEHALTLLQQHPETPDSLAQAEDALQQMRSVLGSLQEYIEVRFLRTRLQHVNLQQVLRAVLRELQEQHVGRDVQITGTPLPTVMGDRRVLQIILSEYLSNALKFTRTRPQARIHLLLNTDETEYRIGVEDNGVGFNMRSKEKAFELFGRLHAGEQYEGTGLGLAVVRRLCERFGGRAWAEGKVDQGATFWFAWPKNPKMK